MERLGIEGLRSAASLALPASGVYRATLAVWRHVATETANPLKRGARARALCMVLKTPGNGCRADAIRLQKTHTYRDWLAFLS